MTSAEQVKLIQKSMQDEKPEIARLREERDSLLDAHAEENRMHKNAFANWQSELRKRVNAEMYAEHVLEEGRRAIGDHFAPNDCYATGPLTGDPIRDLVECPACSFIAMYDKYKADAALRKAGAL